MSGEIPKVFSSPFRRAQLLLLPQYVASAEFMDLATWDKANGNGLLTVRGSTGRSQPVNCIIVGIVTSDRPHFARNGTYNPRFDSSDKAVKGAKYQFTISRPNEETDPEFAEDWDIASKKIKSLQTQVAKTNEHRYFLLVETLKDNPPMYSMRMGYRIWEPKTAKNSTHERNRMTQAYRVDTEYSDMFEKLKLSNHCSVMPVFVPESDEAIQPEQFEDRLIGALVEVTFNMCQFHYGNAEFDTFTGKVQSVVVLKKDIPEDTGFNNIVVRKPSHIPQTPTRGEHVNAAKAFVPSLQRIPQPIFVQGSSNMGHKANKTETRPSRSGEMMDGLSSSASTMSSGIENVLEGEDQEFEREVDMDDSMQPSPSKKRKTRDDA
ncbi:hypothetical protein BDZ97DRAFT_1930581 [Flammula alnicola]|nr:hypothetical protein BDZ97DRAFT_1930581 [Flammula alnicola]